MPHFDAPTGQPLYFLRNGPRQGAPIVLLGPVGFAATFWDAQIQALSGTHDVIAVEVPNQNQGAAAPSFDDAVKDLAALLGHLEVESAHLVGISVGSMIAQTFALTHPQMVRSLCLLGTVATFSDGARTAPCAGAPVSCAKRAWPPLRRSPSRVGLRPRSSRKCGK